MPCLLVFLGAVIYLAWLSTWKYSTAVGAKCRDPLWRRVVGVASGDIQLQTLRKSEGFPVEDLVLRWLSWDTTSLHHPHHLDGFVPRPDPARSGGELADGLCWARRAGKRSCTKLLQKATPSKAHQWSGISRKRGLENSWQAAIGGQWWSKQAEVASALTHAAPWKMVRAAGRVGEASGDGPDIWRNTAKADRVLISSPLSASPQN